MIVVNLLLLLLPLMPCYGDALPLLLLQLLLLLCIVGDGYIVRCYVIARCTITTCYLLLLLIVVDDTMYI